MNTKSDPGTTSIVDKDSAERSFRGICSRHWHSIYGLRDEGGKMAKVQKDAKPCNCAANIFAIWGIEPLALLIIGGFILGYMILWKCNKVDS